MILTALAILPENGLLWKLCWKHLGTKHLKFFPGDFMHNQFCNSERLRSHMVAHPTIRIQKHLNFSLITLRSMLSAFFVIASVIHFWGFVPFKCWALAKKPLSLASCNKESLLATDSFSFTQNVMFYLSLLDSLMHSENILTLKHASALRTFRTLQKFMVIWPPQTL